MGGNQTSVRTTEWVFWGLLGIHFILQQQFWIVNTSKCHIMLYQPVDECILWKWVRWTWIKYSSNANGHVTKWNESLSKTNELKVGNWGNKEGKVWYCNTCHLIQSVSAWTCDHTLEMKGKLIIKWKQWSRWGIVGVWSLGFSKIRIWAHILL